MREWDYSFKVMGEKKRKGNLVNDIEFSRYERDLDTRDNSQTKFDIILLDLDGVLIETESGETFPKGIWDMEINIELLEILKMKKPKFIFISSNQGGIESGFVKEEYFESKLEYLKCCVEEFTGAKVYTDYCTGMKLKTNFNRKPNTGMFESFLKTIEIMDSYKATGGDCVYIGNETGYPGDYSSCDLVTSNNLGSLYYDYRDFQKIFKKP